MIGDRFRWWGSMAAVILLVGGMVPAAADPGFRGTVERPFRISGGAATGYDSDAAVAFNPVSGEWLVVWADGRDTSPGGAIAVYAQRVGADGSRLGPNRRVSELVPRESNSAYDANALYPDVACSAVNGQCLVVWRDNRLDESRGWDVYGQRITPTGALAGGNVRISGGAATGDELDPAVAYSPAANRYLVAWEDTRSDVREIWAQWLSATGARVGGNFEVTGSPAEQTVNADVACSSTGPCLVVWEDFRRFEGDVFGQRIGITGARLGRNFAISTGHSARADYDPAVAYDAVSDRYLAVWETDRRNLFGQRGWDIFARVVGPGGALIGQNLRVSAAAATGHELNPAAGAVSGGGFVVIWEDFRNISTLGEDIFGQHVTSVGAKTGGNFRIGGGAADDLFADVACRTDNAECLTVWEDYRRLSTRKGDIWGRRVD